MKPVGPTRLALVLEETLARLGLDRRLDDYRVWQAWDEVVGQTISRNAQPVRLDGDRLVVAVRTPGWLQELSLLQRELISKVNAWMGRQVIRDMFFVVGRVETDERTASPVSPRRGAAEAAPARPSAPSAAIAAATKKAPKKSAKQSPTEEPPQVPGANPEIAAAFERLWIAARNRTEPDAE